MKTCLVLLGAFHVAATEDLTCKQGFTILKIECPNNSSKCGYSGTGCYKVFTEELTWEEASSKCEDANNTVDGVHGFLAAARSQVEQDFLVELANKKKAGLTFWISGNSKSTSRHWTWGAPYYADVVFYGSQYNKSYPNGMMSDVLPRGMVASSTYYSDMALLNGFQGSYAWKIMSGNESMSYICHKRACTKDKDVLDGLCSTQAYSALNSVEETDSISQVGVGFLIVFGLAVFVVICVVLLWFVRREWFFMVRATVFGCCCCCCIKRKRSASTISDFKPVFRVHPLPESLQPTSNPASPSSRNLFEDGDEDDADELFPSNTIDDTSEPDENDNNHQAFHGDVAESLPRILTQDSPL